jgi:deoxycytidylate deaminase
MANENFINRCFEKAKNAALLSDYGKFHVGCIAVYENQIIGVGCNSNKTHPKQKYYNKYRHLSFDRCEPMPKIHAEMMCLNSISKLDVDFSKVTLFVYRQLKMTPYGMARPCQACMNAIKDLGIKNIFYTSNDGYVRETIAANNFERT